MILSNRVHPPTKTQSDTACLPNFPLDISTLCVLPTTWLGPSMTTSKAEYPDALNRAKWNSSDGLERETVRKA